MDLNEILTIMDTLLGENGCPWDKQQTHESLRKHMREECEEAIEAIDKQDMEGLREELGDVLLQVVFHAKLAEKAGFFTMDDVINTLINKLVTRHSHVFGNDSALTPSDALKIWNANKQKERS